MLNYTKTLKPSFWDYQIWVTINIFKSFAEMDKRHIPLIHMAGIFTQVNLTIAQIVLMSDLEEDEEMTQRMALSLASL